MIRSALFLIGAFVLGASPSVAASNSSLIPEKAALLVSAGSNLVETFEGSVDWERSPPSAGVPEVCANILIPGAEISVTARFSKAESAHGDVVNVDLTFLPLSGAKFGLVSYIAMIQMRYKGEAQGVYLAGAKEPSGLNRFRAQIAVEKESINNVDLLVAKDWFDIPVLLAPDIVGKLTFQKGVSGDALIHQVFGEWKLQH